MPNCARPLYVLQLSTILRRHRPQWKQGSVKLIALSPSRCSVAMQVGKKPPSFSDIYSKMYIDYSV